MDIDNRESIFSAKQLLRLFFQPKLFFLNLQNLNRESIYIFVYITAVYLVMDRLDTQLLKAQASISGSMDYGWLTDTWISYWGFIAIFSIFVGFFFWYVFGWWYEMRLKWSGVVDQPAILVRQVLTMQWSIVAIPSLMIALIQTTQYPSYTAAFLSPDLWPGWVILFFYLYSCWVSYSAVKTVFSANKWAIFWFLILPLATFASVMAAYIRALS